jgi:hypothetical protein
MSINNNIIRDKAGIALRLRLRNTVYKYTIVQCLFLKVIILFL